MDIARLGLEVDSTGIVKATKALDKLEDRGAKAEKSTGKLSKGFTTLKAAAVAAAGAIAVIGISNIVEQSATASLALDSINSSLTVATGSAEAAAIEFGFLRNEAERLGLEFQTSATAYASLAAAARGTNLEGQATRDIFIATTEAMTALGRGAQETERALTAFEQMISKGNVSAEELRGQLGEVLPGAFQIAARSMGVTTQELDKMLRDGEVLASDLLPKMAAELSNTFSEQAESRAKGLQAEINRFKTAVFDLQTSGNMQGLADAIRDITTLVSDPSFQQGFAAFVGGTIRLGGFIAERAAAIGNFFTDTLQEQSSNVNELIDNLERRLENTKHPIVKLRIKEDLAEARAEAERLQQLIWGNADTPTLNLPSTGGQSTEAVTTNDNLGPVLRMPGADEIETIDLIGDRYEELAEMAARLNDTLRTPQEIYQDEIELLNELRDTRKQGTDQGLISYEEYTRGVKAAQEKLDDSLEQSHNDMSKFAERAAENMQDVFADFLFDPFESGIDGMLKGFIDVLRRMAAEAAAAQIFEALGSSGGGGSSGGAIASIIGSLFSYDGGGYTGQGSRSGGVDGKGGFPAILHPQETVIDHTKNNAASLGITIINQTSAPIGNAETRISNGQMQVIITEAVQQSRQAVANDMYRGGNDVANAIESNYSLERSTRR